MPDQPQGTPQRLPARGQAAARGGAASGRNFPASKCGARLDFDPGVPGPAVSLLRATPRRSNLADRPRRARLRDGYLAANRRNRTALPGRDSEVKCKPAARVVLLEDKVATDRCPYCGTHLENKPEAAKAMVQPEALLPFAVGQAQGRRGLPRVAHRVCGSRRGAEEAGGPAAGLNGAYVPFWTFDSMTYTHLHRQHAATTTRRPSITPKRDVPRRQHGAPDPDAHRDQDAAGRRSPARCGISSTTCWCRPRGASADCLTPPLSPKELQGTGRFPAGVPGRLHDGALHRRPARGLRRWPRRSWTVQSGSSVPADIGGNHQRSRQWIPSTSA